MKWQIPVYSGLGVALAVLSLSTVGWAMSVAGPPPTQDQTVETVAAEPLPAPVPIPADDVIRGSVAAVADQLKIPVDSSVPQGNQLKVCDAEVKGWVRSDSMRLSADGVGLSIQIAAWRAGAAAEAFDTLESAAAQCADVSKSESADDFRASISSNDGQWSGGVHRIGDVLVAVSASSDRSQDPAATVDGVILAAQKVMKSRLGTTCVDPTSNRDNDYTSRDPYSSKYSGYKVASVRKLQDQPVMTKAEIAAIRAQKPSSNWQGPESVSFPDLAPLVVPPNSPPQPYTADPSTAIRGTAPTLPDPTKFKPPTTSMPNDDALKEPAEPTIGDGVSVAMIPAVDTSGPGCGWEFTGTVTPEVSQEELLGGAQAAVIDALIRDTEVQSQRMVQALKWPTERKKWVAAKSIELSWNDYRAQLSSAEDRLAAAKKRYEESVQQWYAGTLVPVAPAVPATPGNPAPAAPGVAQ